MLLLVWIDRNRGCFRVPFVVGGFFQVPMYDPPPLRCVGVWIGLGFSRNCLGFFLESDRGGAFSGLLSFWGGCFRFFFR